MYQPKEFIHEDHIIHHGGGGMIKHEWRFYYGMNDLDPRVDIVTTKWMEKNEPTSMGDQVADSDGRTRRPSKANNR